MKTYIDKEKIDKIIDRDICNGLREYSIEECYQNLKLGIKENVVSERDILIKFADWCYDNNVDSISLQVINKYIKSQEE